MGHDKSVHKEYYRLPEDTIQLAKVSKIMLQLESGKMDKCKGKSLDDLEVDGNEEEELSADEDDLGFLQDQDEGYSMTAETPPTMVQIENRQQPNIVKRSPVSKKRSTGVSQRKEWSEEEKQAVEMELGIFFLFE